MPARLKEDRWATQAGVKEHFCCSPCRSAPVVDFAANSDETAVLLLLPEQEFPL